MRFIDNSVVMDQLPVDWEQKAEVAFHAIRDLVQNGATQKERSDAVSKYSDLWRDLSPILATISMGKCWYCESRQIRSDMPVDHYRPKGQVVGVDQARHRGYWWLAFDWTNYRYSCTYCNSKRTDRVRGTVGGKGSHFPVRDETRRCYEPADVIWDEVPCLLDPVIEGDSELLTFDRDGAAQATYTIEYSDWLNRRAVVSIQLYHLNHIAVQEARKAVSDACRNIIANADASFPQYQLGSASGNAVMRETIRQLLDYVVPNKEYSATARATIGRLRSDGRPWLDAVLNRT